MKQLTWINFMRELFDPKEGVCLSKDLQDVLVRPFSNAMEVGMYSQDIPNFFVINPLKTRRLDSNVTAYRNILLEFDSVGLVEQKAILDTVPFTTLVFSGGKSYHAIISLETPCSTRDEYDTLVRRIYDRVPHVDKQVKNPSRFSRTPFAFRDGVEQALMQINERISTEKLESWLGPDTAPDDKVVTSAKGPKRILKGATWYFLNEGAPEGEWNKTLFMAALDMARAGYSAEEARTMVKDIEGRLTASDKRTIASAFKIAADE